MAGAQLGALSGRPTVVFRRELDGPLRYSFAETLRDAMKWLSRWSWRALGRWCWPPATASYAIHRTPKMLSRRLFSFWQGGLARHGQRANSADGSIRWRTELLPGPVLVPRNVRDTSDKPRRL